MYLNDILLFVDIPKKHEKALRRNFSAEGKISKHQLLCKVKEKRPYIPFVLPSPPTTLRYIRQ